MLFKLSEPIYAIVVTPIKNITAEEMMNRKFYTDPLSAILLIFIISALQPLYSQDKNNPDSIIVQLDEVVVQGFNRPVGLTEIPASVTHIGLAQIETERPVFDLLPVLENATGVFAHFGAPNTSRVTIRGIGARVPYATGKIRGYLNNIPLTDASGTTLIQDIDPSIIQSVEVMKGPATSAYGAGLGGTVIMNVKNPSLRPTQVSNTSQTGSFGLFRNAVSGNLSTDNIATSFTYSHARNDGYRQNNSFQRDAITSFTQWQTGTGIHFSALAGWVKLNAQIPSSINGDAFADDPTSAAANWLKTQGYEDSQKFFGGLSSRLHPTEQLKLDISIFSVINDEKEMRPFDVLYQQRASVGTRIVSDYTIEFGNTKGNLIAGGEYFLEDYTYSNYQNIDGEGIQGDQTTDNAERVNSVNAFVQTDFDIREFNFSAGVNLNYIQRDYDDLFNPAPENLSGVYDYGLIVSPRVSAGYSIANDHLVFASASHGFTPPSLEETLDSEGFINPDIVPEKSWNLETGIRGSFWDERFFYDVNVFQMFVQDLLVAERVGEDAWVGRNAGSSEHRGVETSFAWTMISAATTKGWVLNDLTLRGGYTFSDFAFTEFNDFDNDRSGNLLPGVPRQVFFSSLYFSWANGLYFQPAFRWVGEMQMNDANTLQTDPYHLLNAIVGYKNTLFNRWDVDVFFRANNITDQKYASMILVNAPSFGGSLPRYYYPGLPVNFQLGLKINFQP